MPPIRTIPTVKPVKTERSHEENQERAYIAASRRSDRSLEARIESARRASEIHKKRTGRALRVTEQDVVNEEMYEEEEEDLPAQYRRLTAHLNTGSLNFNRRFHAYLLSQQGTRSALASFDPTVASGMMQYPNAPYFANPMMHTFSNSQPPQAAPQSPQSYRHAPYPVSPGSNPRLHSHQRSASVSGVQDTQNGQLVSPGISNINPLDPGDHRRMSLPVRTPSSAPLKSPNGQTRLPTSGDTSPSAIVGKDFNQSVPMAKAESPSRPNSAGQPQSTQSNQDSITCPSPAVHTQAQNFSFGPLSPSLPVESQMFLGPALDPLDPRTSLLMAGSESFVQPFSYSYNPNPSSKSKFMKPPTSGMSQTLAAPALPLFDSVSDGAQSFNIPLSAASLDDSSSLFNSSYGCGGDDNYVDPAKTIMTRNSSTQGSTDGANDWSNFINGSIWDDSAV